MFPEGIEGSFRKPSNSVLIFIFVRLCKRRLTVRRGCDLNYKFIEKYWGYYLSGLELTIILSIFSVLFGIVLGILFALLKLSRFRVLKAIAVSYINFIRGTPILVQIYIIYYGLYGIGINFPDMGAAVVALAINSGAYVAEIVRAGIQAVDKGQTEAARSLGMTHGNAMRLVIIPQAIKNILPALCNEFIVVTKNTSMVSVIGIHELMYNADTVRGNTFLAFEPLAVAAVIYFSISYVLTKAVEVLERRLKYSD